MYLIYITSSQRITEAGETQLSYNSLKVTAGINLELIKLKSYHSTEIKAL